MKVIDQINRKAGLVYSYPSNNSIFKYKYLESQVFSASTHFLLSRPLVQSLMKIRSPSRLDLGKPDSTEHRSTSMTIFELDIFLTMGAEIFSLLKNGLVSGLVFSE